MKQTKTTRFENSSQFANARHQESCGGSGTDNYRRRTCEACWAHNSSSDFDSLEVADDAGSFFVLDVDTGLMVALGYFGVTPSLLVSSHSRRRAASKSPHLSW
jgi:hypothetical protein